MNTLLSSATLIGLASLAQAQVVAIDCFHYTGALTANGWTAHSGAGNRVVMADGTHATLDQAGGSGEDINLSFAPFGATDTIYASFDLRLPSGNPVNPDGSGLYLAHFKDAAFGFRGRTGVLSPAAAGDFQLAINGNSSNLGAGAQWPVDLSFDTWYTVVISWDASTGEARLWLDPTSMASTSIAHTGSSSGDLMEAFALRQSNDYTGLNHIDNIVIGHTYADVTSLVTTGGTGSPTSVGTPVIGTAGGEPLTGNLAFTLTGSSLVPAGNPNMFGTIVVLGFGSLTAGTPIPGAPVGAIQYVNSSTSSFLLADGAGTVNLSLGIPSSTTLCGLSVSAQLGDFDTSLATILKVGTSAGLTFRVSN